MATAVRAALTGIGLSVPDRVMTNADFEKFLDTSDEWITKRTGIKERHLVTEGQTTATLATQASRAALNEPPAAGSSTVWPSATSSSGQACTSGYWSSAPTC